MFRCVFASVLIASSALACATSETCIEGFGQTVSGIDRSGRPGGWDANGRGLTGTIDGDDVFSGLLIEGASLAGGKLTLSSGGVLAATELYVVDGAGRSRTARVSSTRDERGILRYDLIIGEAPACEDGELGVFVSGRWDTDGRYYAGPSMTFSCAKGAIAQCIDRGVAPWSSGQEQHQACIRAIESQRRELDACAAELDS